MTWTETFKRMAEHYTAMAMTPGWWQYAQARVAEMEQQDAWMGLRAEISRRVRESGYRPSKNDLEPLERVAQPLPLSRRWHGG